MISSSNAPTITKKWQYVTTDQTDSSSGSQNYYCNSQPHQLSGIYPRSPPMRGWAKKKRALTLAASLLSCSLFHRKSTFIEQFFDLCQIFRIDAHQAALVLNLGSQQQLELFIVLQIL